MNARYLIPLLLIAVLLSAGCLEKSETLSGIKSDLTNVKEWMEIKMENNETDGLYLAVQTCNETCGGNFLFSQNENEAWGCACL